MPTVTPQGTPTNPISATADKQPDMVEATAQGSAATSPESTDASQDPALSPKFAALARKEKAIRARMRDLEAREKALQAKETQVTGQTKEPDSSWKQRLMQNPLEVLNEAGLSYDQLTSLILNGPKPETLEIQSVKQELMALKQAQEQQKLREQQAALAQREQAKKQILTDVTQLVSTDESFELIKSQNAMGAVVDLIEKTFDEEGYIMDLETAAREVEEVLFEKAMELTKLKKLQGKLQPQPSPAENSAPKQPETQQKQQITTLSNRMVQSPTKPLTAKERRERAILAFQGKLNA